MAAWLPGGWSRRRIRIAAVVDLKGQQALGLTADATAVWAIAHQAGTLSRVDPTTNAVTRTMPLAIGAVLHAQRDVVDGLSMIRNRDNGVDHATGVAESSAS